MLSLDLSGQEELANVATGEGRPLERDGAWDEVASLWAQGEALEETPLDDAVECLQAMCEQNWEGALYWAGRWCPGVVVDLRLLKACLDLSAAAVMVALPGESWHSDAAAFLLEARDHPEYLETWREQLPLQAGLNTPHQPHPNVAPAAPGPHRPHTTTLSTHADAFAQPLATGSARDLQAGTWGTTWPTETTTAPQAPPTSTSKRKRAKRDKHPTAASTPKPNTDESILAGIRDTDPEGTLFNTARRMRIKPGSLTSWLQRRSPALGLNEKTPSDALKFIRANLDTVSVALVGKRAAELTRASSPSAHLAQHDKRVIATLLHHPDMTIGSIARLYNQRPEKIRQWVEGVGTALGVDEKAPKIMDHVRHADNRASVLQVTGLTVTTIPQNLIETGKPKPLNTRDKQVIATLLHHPYDSYPAIAEHYQQRTTTLQSWLIGLATRLAISSEPAKIVIWVRDGDNRADLLRLTGLTETTIAQNLIETGSYMPSDERV
ncbi:hypothetical protein [Streptomyces sp. NPDC051014]|uniref:hypothetical protein n=1 Tax=Streptomyces sp. NPDC051014 TaxID=3155751 RepID=UPI00340E01F2